MVLLKEKIEKYGKVIDNQILKVDSFLNHQVDAELMQAIGKEFKRLFSDKQVTKILTVESSGIAPAVFTALEFSVPLVFARKKKSLTLDKNLLIVDVMSYTKNEMTNIAISKDYIGEKDSVLIIDDFLANGQVAKGLMRLTEEAGASVQGIGIVIEKSFQSGRKIIEETGIPIHSLARIKSLQNNVIEFIEE